MRAEVTEFYGLGTSLVLMLERQLEAQSTSAPKNMVRWRAGLPIRTFEGSVWIDMNLRLVTMQHTVKIWDDRPRILLQLLWVGFAINSLFYAAILWLAIPGPFALRPHIRRKRGWCIKCGYELRGDFSAGSARSPTRPMLP